MDAAPLRIATPHTPEIELINGRLLMRRFLAGDAPLLTELDADPEVKMFIDGGAPPNPDLDREAIIRIRRQYAEFPGFGLFAAHLLGTGEFIGWFHFRPDREIASDTDLGYRLMRKSWGAGYATEGSLALMQRGFGKQGVTRVVARAMLGNSASWRVMEKLGLTRLAEFEESRFPGADKRAVKYAMTSAEFAGKWPSREGQTG